MDEFNWEYTKEANFDLFGEDFAAYCTDDSEESSNTDSMKPCYSHHYNDTNSKVSTSSTLSSDSVDGDAAVISEVISPTTTAASRDMYQEIDYHCFENEHSTYDSDTDNARLSSKDLIMNVSFCPPTSQFAKSGRCSAPGSFSSKESSAASHNKHSFPSASSHNLNAAHLSAPSYHGAPDDLDDDNAFIALYHTEMEFQELMASHTDPVGKFLKKVQLTAQEALDLNIQSQLLSAPRKPRTKYGKRRLISAEERMAVNKERNREHARATRMRKRIFKEVQEVIGQRQQECESPPPPPLLGQSYSPLFVQQPAPSPRAQRVGRSSRGNSLV